MSNMDLHLRDASGYLPRLLRRDMSPIRASGSEARLVTSARAPGKCRSGIKRMRAPAWTGAQVRLGAMLAALAFAAGLGVVFTASVGADPDTGPEALMLCALGLLLMMIVLWSAWQQSRQAGAPPARLAGLGLSGGALVAGCLTRVEGLIAAGQHEPTLVFAASMFGIGALLSILPRSSRDVDSLDSARNAQDSGETAAPAQAPGSGARSLRPTIDWKHRLDGAALLFVTLGNAIMLTFLVAVVVTSADAQVLQKTFGEGTEAALWVGLPIVLLGAHQWFLVDRGLRRHRPVAVLAAGIGIMTMFLALAFLALDGPSGGHTWSMLIASLALLGAVAWYRAARRTTARRQSRRLPSADILHQLQAQAEAVAPEVARFKDLLRLWLATPGFILMMYGLSLGFGLPLYLAGQEDLALYEVAWYEGEFLALWIVLLIVVRRSGRGWSWLGFRPFPLQYLLVVPAFVGIEFGVTWITQGMFIPSSPALSQYQAQLDPIIEPSAASVFLLFFGAVIVAPLVEETLCRGCIFTGFSEHTSTRSAAVLSAVFFTLLHVIPSFAPLRLDLHPGQAITAFVAGLLYAGLRHDSDSLFPGMIAHGVWNLMVIF